MVQNIIPQKKKEELDYHPLMYYHFVRATEMPILEEKEDLLFEEFNRLMCEYAQISNFGKKQYEQYDFDTFTNKVLVFIRALI